MIGKSIDDLVGLYDKIGNTLPNMSDQEINYLLLDSAQAHKESLLRTNSALTSAPTSSIIDSHFESQLEKVKAELHSIRYERMVVDVFTRQTVDQTQRNAFGSLDPTLRQEKISTSRRNNVLALDPKKRVYQPTASFASKTTASKTAPSSSNSINNAAAALASRKRLQRLQEYIDIPTYQPGTNFTSNQPIENIRASTLFPLRVRSIGRDSLVVPSLRQGSSLPVELSTLRLKTTIAPPYSSDLLRRSSGDDADTTSLPLARNLYRQIKRNEAQIHSVRESLQQHTAKCVIYSILNISSLCHLTSCHFYF